jgi:uncharacterized membrane protein YsdA (DUF1294 family)
MTLVVVILMMMIVIIIIILLSLLTSDKSYTTQNAFRITEYNTRGLDGK